MSNTTKTALFSLLLVANTLFAQTKFQSPDEFLPHPLGEQFSAHNQLVNYFEYVASQKSDMTKLVRLGATSEERPQDRKSVV